VKEATPDLRDQKDLNDRSLYYLVAYFIPATVVLMLLLVMPGRRSRQESSHGVPPGWNPEGDNAYSFRAWMTDITLCVMVAELRPEQQVAAIIMRLEGSAREMSRMITPQEMANGGVVNGQMIDPVSYLLHALQGRYAALDEETRLSSMTEMLAFARRSGEGINSLLSRFEVVRQRAAMDGQFTMSVKGCALQLLRACGIQPQQLMILLQPTNCRLPQTEGQLSALTTQLRRYGHISERTHGVLDAEGLVRPKLCPRGSARRCGRSALAAWSRR
jgi:hypothetical protein